MNQVDYLLQNRFSAQSEQMKLEIKRLGRHIPDNFSISQKCKSQNRNFSPRWFEKTPWLTGSISRKSLFCFPCLLFDTAENGVWSKNGFSDMHHLGERTRSHDSSPGHITCCLRLQMLGRVDIRTQLSVSYRDSIRRHNQKVDNNKHVLSKIIDAIKFCGAFELALRGHDETETSNNPGVFRGIINLMAELDNVLANHLANATVFKGTSNTIQNELLDCMYTVYMDCVKEEIGNAQFVSIQADETTDVANKCQLVTIVRYLVNYEIKERFLSYQEAQIKTARAITELLQKQIEPYNLEEKLIAQTYDGASTMSGRHNGVQAQMRNQYPHAHFVHCYAHQLNLIMQQACGQIRPIKVFFESLKGFPAFFSGSPKRTAALGRWCNRRLPRVVATRWNFQIRVVNSIYENRDELIQCLLMIRDGDEGAADEDLGFEWDNKTISEAAGLLKWLEDDQFMSFLSVFHRIMPHVDILYCTLQKREISADAVASALTNFTEAINHIRGELDNIIMVPQQNDEAGPPRKRTKLSYVDVKAACVEACDIVISQATDRFSSVGHLISFQLVDPSLFSKFADTFPTQLVDAVPEHFPMISLNKLRTELGILYGSEEFHNAKTSLQLLQCMHENNLTSAFSEAYKLLQINATTPMTSSESERCFSTLKRVKSYSRNTMGNERLNALAMLSIHKELIRSIPDFNERVITHFAQLKTRRAEFLYKSVTTT